MAKAPVMLVLAIGLMLRCAHSAKPPTPADTGRRAQNEDVYHVALFRIPKEHLKEATSAFREMAVAARKWHMKAERFPSVTDPDSTIFRLSDVTEARL